MEGHSHSVEARDMRVREVREAFFTGERHLPSVLPLGSRVLGSWQRCRGNGLVHSHALRGVGPEDTHVLKSARDRDGWLLHHAQGVIRHLHDQIRSTGSVVVLSDASGLILESCGDSDFLASAEQVALLPGASWAESLRGTNAVGTALVEQVPVEVVGSEHYFECNTQLTCSAAPIFDPAGRLIGVLDISGQVLGYQRHTLGLARMTAQILERRLFEAEHGRELLLNFHHEPGSVGTLQDGLIALSAGGELLAADNRALELLGLNRKTLGRVDFSMLFETPLGQFLDRAARDPMGIVATDLKGGVRLYARLRNGMPLRAGAFGTRPTEEKPTTQRLNAPTRAKNDCLGDNTTLACLDTGDARLAQALQRAGRILGKDIPLLILGESGVGKERFAKAFHHSGPRRDASYVALNCAAIPEALIESELFGYVGGAFTGARKEGMVGKIQQANGGTLFLDEIGDMPIGLQARLLRVLQERVVTPVGGMKAVSVDISLVCATHCNLAEAVAQGKFRQDLYYRLNGLSVSLPALRERSDIRRLVANIVESESPAGRSIVVAEDVLAHFERYRWPGNIRQMQNTLRLAIALLDSHEDTVRVEHLPEELLHAQDNIASPPLRTAAAGAAPVAPAPVTGESLDVIERRAIDAVLAEVQGNISAAARRLGISRNTLYRRLGRL